MVVFAFLNTLCWELLDYSIFLDMETSLFQYHCWKIILLGSQTAFPFFCLLGCFWEVWLNCCPARVVSGFLLVCSVCFWGSTVSLQRVQVWISSYLSWLGFTGLLESEKCFPWFCKLQHIHIFTNIFKCFLYSFLYIFHIFFTFLSYFPSAWKSVICSR